MSVNDSNMIVSIDIGTSKVIVLVAQLDAKKNLTIKGLGQCASAGMRRGTVVHTELVVSAMKRAIADAESMAHCKIHSSYINLSGIGAHYFNSHCHVSIKEKKVNKGDIEHLLTVAKKTFTVPVNQKFLQMISVCYRVDEHHWIRNPLGVEGTCLYAHTCFATYASDTMHWIQHCIDACGIVVERFVLNVVASSEAVLTQSERDRGICLVDIGDGIVDLVVFSSGRLHYASAIPIAGHYVTHDIATALQISLSEAEHIKIQYASAMSEYVDRREQFHVTSNANGDTVVSKHFLSQVVEARYAEIFTLVKQAIKKQDIHELISGIVLTGGAVNMEGTIELAEKIFCIPVRLGIPLTTTEMDAVLNHPIYATSTGLLQYGCKAPCNEMGALETNVLPSNHRLRRLQRWFESNF